MTKQLTPPPELVQQWANSSPIQHSDESWAYELFIAHHAARWGADQELGRCCAWLQERIREGWNPCHLEDLRNGRWGNHPAKPYDSLVKGNA